MTIINPDAVIKKVDKPYRIWIIENFLKKEIIDRISKNWVEAESERWHKGYSTVNGKKNILEQGMLGISELNLMPDAIAEISEHFHSQKFTDQISKLLGIEGLIPDKAMRWSGMRTMLPGSFQLIHSDARLSPESGLRKELTVLVYTHPEYNESTDTGDLEIWDDDMSECLHKIPPKYNSAIIFLNSDTSYHGVPNVNFERRAFTFSILKDGKTTERTKALFVPRPNDPDEVREDGLKRSTIQESKI